MSEQQPQQNIPLQATPEVLKGVYTNNMQVSHTKEEFILDFLSMSHFPSAASLLAKIITSPAHYKRMVAALNDNLKKYEASFGAIDAPAPEKTQGVSESAEFGFNTNRQ